MARKSVREIEAGLKIPKAPEYSPSKDPTFLKNHHQALRELPDPRAIPSLTADYSAAAIRERERPASMAGRPADVHNSIRYRNYVNDLEQAYYANRGGFSATFLSMIDPDDLAVFADPDFAELVAPEIRPTLAAFRAGKERDDVAIRLAELYYQEELERAELVDGVKAQQGALGSVLRPDEALPETGLEVAALEEAQIEGFEFRAADYEKALREMAARQSNPDDLEQGLMDFVGRGMTGFSNFVGFAGGVALTGAQLLLPSFLVEDPWQPLKEGLHPFVSEEEATRYLGYHPEDTREVQEAHALLEQWRRGQGPADLKEKLLTHEIPETAWEDALENDPALIDSYIKTYGPDLAQMGFFTEFQDLRDEPSLEAATEDILNSFDAEIEGYVQSLEESNFRSSGQIMEWMTSWGTLVDSMNANIVALGINATDEEKRSLLREARVDDFMLGMAETVEEGGHTPAGVLGLEGTLGGLFLNFGMGMIFDPTNLLFTPALKFGRLGVASRGAVRTVMRSPAVRMAGRDIAYVLSSRHRSGLGKANIINSFTEVGLGGQLLEAAGYVDNTLPAHPWVQHPLGKHASETSTVLIEQLLDPVQLKQLDELNPETVGQVEASLRNKGFEEPLILELDSQTGRVNLAEGGGLKRLAAARNIDGLERVPVVVRERVRAAEPPSSPAVPKKVERRPDDYVYHGTSRGGPDGDYLDRGGVSVDRARAERYSAGVKIVTDKGEEIIFTVDDLGRIGPTDNIPELLNDKAVDYMRENRVGGRIEQMPGEVIAIRKKDLPPEVREQIDAGMDIEDLAPFNTGGGLLISERWSTSPSKVEKGPQGVPIEQVGGKQPRNLEVSESGHINPRQLFDEKTLGVKGDHKKIGNLIQEALLRGADVPYARQNVGAVALGTIFHRLADSTIGQALTPYVQSVFDIDKVPMDGVVGSSQLMEMVQFFGSNDLVWTNTWMGRVLHNEQALGRANGALRQADAELDKLYKMDQHLAERQMAESPWDPDITKALGEESLQGLKTIEQARAVTRKIIREKEAARRAQIHEAHGAVNWQDLVDEMMDDYNRTHIATQKQWQGTDPLTGLPYINPETGLVDWHHIHRYRGPETDEILDAEGGRKNIRSSKLEAERQLRQEKMEIELDLGHTAVTKNVLNEFERAGPGRGAVSLPATPIELAAATKMGGAKYTKWSQEAWFASVRSGAYMIDQAWKANVLLTPRTFAVMSVDELTSLMHQGGAQFVSRYIQARADKMRAGMGNFEKSAAYGRLSPKAAERIRALRDIPEEYALYDQIMAEHAARELTTMKKGDLGFPQAARQYTQRYVQNPAMRAYFRGQDEFVEWYKNSPEGHDFMLNMTVQFLDENGAVARRPLRNAEEAYRLVDAIWTHLENVARKEGVKDPAAFRQAWQETAAQIDADQSGRVYALPDWVHEYVGPIQGYRATYPGSNQLWHVIARGYELGAGNPANFRRGLSADLMRTAESTRLTRLFEDQGKTIVGDAELMELLKHRGIDVTEINPFDSPWLHAELFDQGIVTKGYIAQLAEKRALDYMTEMTYSFEQGTRAGRQAKAVFPFGPAWGEMYSRWGRALGSRAIARPWLRRVGMQKMVQKVADHLPFNPRTAGFLSRVANTDLGGIDVIPGEGESDLDFSSITFLPTAGEAGLSVLIPSLGPLPMLGLDELLRALLDPVGDPQGYQQAIDAVAEFLPGARFTGRGENVITQGLVRFLGSGNTGMMISLATEFGKGVLHNPNRDLWRFTGDIRSELNRSRAVSATFSDPDLLSEILSAQDPESVNMLILSGLYEADQTAALQTGGQTLQQWTVPIRGPLDTNLDEIYQSWTSAARALPEFFNTENIPPDEVLANDGEALRRTGDDVRRQFWALPPWQRDIVVATNPALAINLVQTWEWSQTAPDYLPGRDINYRTVGSSPDDQNLAAALDRHSVYVQNGWVVPRDTRLRPHEAIGTALEAKDNVSRFIYESSAEEMNNVRWQNLVTEETKTKLDLIVTRMPASMNIDTSRDLWETWSTNREGVLDELYRRVGVDPRPGEETESIKDALEVLVLLPEEVWRDQRQVAIDMLERLPEIEQVSEGEQALIDAVLELAKIPEAEEAWSTEWRGDSVEAFSQRMRGFPVFMSEEATVAAAAMGIDVSNAMTGEQFVSTLQDYRFKEVKGPAWNAVKLNYTNYLNDRGAAFTAGMSTLNDVTNDPSLREDYRTNVRDFLGWLDVQAADHPGDMPRAIQDEAVDRFMRLSEVGPDYVDWEQTWHRAFRTRFGPLEWEAPEPPAPIGADGRVNVNAWQPHIQTVVDGDTLVVSQNRGPSLTGDIELPFLDVHPRMEHGTGFAQGHQVRLIGINAPEYSVSVDDAEAAKQRLEDALTQARQNGDRIWLVRDPEFAGSNTDPFGRELAWLWIGDKPFYFPDLIRRTD